jgi:hypothetical protein
MFAVVVGTNRENSAHFLISMIKKHTVVAAGRDTGISRNIEYSSLLNDGIAVLSTGGGEGKLDVVVDGGKFDVVVGGGGPTGADFIVCC